MNKEQKIREFIDDVESITLSKVIGFDFIALGDNDSYYYQDYLLHSKNIDDYLDYLDKHYFNRNPSLLLTGLKEKMTAVKKRGHHRDKEVSLTYKDEKIPKVNFTKGTSLHEHDNYYWHLWCKIIADFYPDCNSIYFVKEDFNNLIQTTALFIYFNTDITRLIERRKRWLNKATKAFLYEEAINIFLPKHIEEIRDRSVRAAISQVMARNMSHNIGSHVLNNLTDGASLSRIGHYECRSYQPPTDLKDLGDENAIIHQLAIYNNYVKCRMDYLSDITFGIPVMHTNKKVYAELFKELDKVRLLLDHITGLSDSFAFKIEFTLNGKSVDDSTDFSVALPNDLLGCQAFYNIIENVIRNTAKHNQNKNRLTTFTINFQEINDSESNISDKEHWYEVEIYDDSKVKDIESLVKAQNDKINLSVLNEKNELRSSSLGLLEMEASAAYLRKLDITELEDNKYLIEHNQKISNVHKRLNILKAFNKAGCLAYRFFVSKPTEFLFVGDLKVGDLQQKKLANSGIWFRTGDAFEKELAEGAVFNHQFLLYQDQKPIADAIQRYRTSLPVRKILIPDSSDWKDLLSSSTFGSIEEAVWKQWFQQTKGSFECINVMTSYSNKKHKQSGRYNLAFSHHDASLDSCKADLANGHLNAFDVLSSQALRKLPGIGGLDLIDYIDEIKTDTPANSVIKCKLYEAYSNKVVVVDERIQRYGKEQYLKMSISTIFSFANIVLPDSIELASENYYIEITRQIEAFIEMALRDGGKFLVVHYSILERMYGSGNPKINERLIAWSKNARVIVTSGRGRPPELLSAAVCYTNLSPILNVFTQLRNKYAINYLLNTARK